MASKKTYVNSITQRLIDTANYTSSDDIGMARYLLEQKTKLRPNVHSTTISECLVEAHKNSLPKKFKRVFKYSKDKSRYIYGNPNSSIGVDHDTSVKEALKGYLSRIENKPLTFLYVKLNSKNVYHYAWKAVIERLQYSFENNELKTLSIKEGIPAFLKGSQLYLSDKSIASLELDGNLEQNGLSMGGVQPEILEGLKDKLVVTYTYTEKKETPVEVEEGEEPEDPIIEYIEHTKNVELDLSHIVDHVKVSPDENQVDKLDTELEYLQTMYYNGTTYKLFEYQYMSGKIPSIDKAESYQTQFGQYYPRIYLRHDGKDLITLPDNDQRKIDTKKITYRLGVDLEEITESINEGIEGLNSNYKYTFLHLTISINKETSDPTTSKYLFNYFDSLYERSVPIPKSEQSEPVIANERAGIKQDVTDNTYSQVINYWKSGKEVRAGKVLEVGKHKVNFIKKAWKVGKWTYYTGCHELIYQVSNNQHIVITVYGLVMEHKYNGQTVRCEWDDENLTIPLNIEVVNGLDNKEQDLLFNKAFQLTVSTLQVVKKKWYQTRIFKFVMAAVSIAMNMFVPGSGFVLQGLMAAVATTLLIGIAVNVLMSVAIDIAVKLGLSPELVGILTAAVVIAFSAYTGGQFDFSKLLNSKEVLKTLSYSVDMYQKSIHKGIEKIQKEMSAFGDYAKDEMKRLEAAQEMLNTGMIPPDLQMLTSPINEIDIYLGETPQDFYTRTVGLDIVDMSYNMEAYFLALATTVPKNRPKRENTLDISDVLLIN